MVGVLKAIIVAASILCLETKKLDMYRILFVPLLLHQLVIGNGPAHPKKHPLVMVVQTLKDVVFQNVVKGTHINF